MVFNIKEIDKIITKEVQTGAYISTSEAEHDLIDTLIERDIDRGIEEGREDIRQGRYTVMNSETNKVFIDELAKELLPQSK